MSTIVYAELTNKREAAPANTSTTTSQPGMKTYVDALSALIPAEVMTLHALTLSATTESSSMPMASRACLAMELS